MMSPSFLVVVVLLLAPTTCRGFAIVGVVVGRRGRGATTTGGGASRPVPPLLLRHRRRSSSSSSSSSSEGRLCMFTGIVEEMGEILSYETKDDMILWDGSRGTGTEMVVSGKVVMDGAYLGCSICVNGACLTATELDHENGTFRVGLAPETLRRTNLGSYYAGGEGDDDDGGAARARKRRLVNLERASEIGGRNSGHFVQGHVDGVGTIVGRWTDENSLFYNVSLPSEYMRYVVPKGFVAVDGASLTVCDVGGTTTTMMTTGTTDPSSSSIGEEEEGGGGWFTFMLVEYTQKKIVIPDKVVGDTVNVEVDVLGKYSERAWGSIVPKMEALERRIVELEDKVMRLEGGGGGGGGGGGDDDTTVVVSGAVSGDPIKYGDAVPGAFSAAAAAAAAAGERWVRAEQEYLHDGKDMNPRRENRNGRGTDWVRTKQTYYDTNY